MSAVTAEAVHQLVEHLFRHRAGQMVATLTRIFGPAHLDLAEDVVQEALVKALRQWPFHGVPDHPAAWLVQVAKNRALDALRRDAALREKEAELRRWAEQTPANDAVADVDEIRDDQLRLMFMCCHEALPREARIALTLKTLGGFGVAEIARAFLVAEPAVAQRLVRAKRKIQEDKIPFTVPSGAADLPRRLDSVLEVLYLMFNEGYSAHQGENLVRRELVQEAMRLTGLLLEQAATRCPRVHALFALMLFQAARVPARVDEAGDLLLLADQDRSLWDRAMIQRGFAHLRQGGRGDELTEYHLQAGIASCHAMAESWQTTDWRQILSYYDMLLAISPSPVVCLNRAVAVAEVDGPLAGLDALGAIQNHPQLQSYYLLPATRGEFHRQAGDCRAAAACFRQALSLACSEPERRFLQAKLRSCAAEG